MTDRVFTAEAMQACADRGHQWRQVRASASHSFTECATCGETWPPLRPYDAAAEAWAAAALALQDVPWKEVPAADPQPPQPATRNVAEPRPRKVRVAKDVERNAEIVRLVAGGMGPSAVARQFGIDPSRVSQIVAKHRAQAQGAV